MATYDYGFGRETKYHAFAMDIDGIHFPSRLEATRYEQLKQLLRAGLIRDLVVHPRYKIAEKTRDPHTGKTIGARFYEGDFEYMDERGRRICEDTKGVQTPMFRLKWDLVRPLYPDVYFIVVTGMEVYGR